MPVGPNIGFQAPIFVSPEQPPGTPAVVVAGVAPAVPALLHPSNARKYVASMKRRRAAVMRPPVTGVPRAKTIGAISLHPVKRAPSLRRKRRVLLRAPLLVAMPTRRILAQPLRKQVRKFRRRRLFLRAPILVTRPGGRIVTHSVRRPFAFRRRHRPVLLRGVLAPGRRVQPLLHRAAGVGLRIYVARRGQVVLFSRGGTAPAVTAKTIKSIILHMRPLRGLALANVLRHQPLVIRPPITGVPRAKTIKAIYTHGVGRYVQMARRRRHKVLLLKSPLLITVPPGRIVLRPVNRRKSGMLRHRRFALIFRSRAGVAAGATQAPPTKPLLHSVRPLRRMKMRRHRALILRAPLLITVRGGRSILVHPIRRRFRRRRPLFLRASPIIISRRTTKPILVGSVARRRYYQRLRRHVRWMLRSVGGQAVSDVAFFDPFDPPNPLGIAGSSPIELPYEVSPAGIVGSNPQEAMFDPPEPIGQVD